MLTYDAGPIIMALVNACKELEKIELAQNIRIQKLEKIGEKSLL